MPEQNGYNHEHGQPLLNQHERSLEKLENFLKDDSCTSKYLGLFNYFNRIF